MSVTCRASASRILGTLVLTWFVVFVGGCATSPTGRSQLTLIPSRQLEAMGIKAFDEIRASTPVEEDSRTNRYVHCVADAITSEVRGQRSDWEVVVFKDETPNAFALPGGKIGVHTGMLEVAENQHQLAAVLGHEVGHVLADHANERASQQQLANIGLSVISGTGQLSSGSMQILGLGAQVGVLLPYSRLHESEADVIGLDLMARAGFDPRESVQLWQRMKTKGGAKPPEFLSTHPADATRIENQLRYLAEALRTYNAARARGKNPRCD